MSCCKDKKSKNEIGDLELFKNPNINNDKDWFYKSLNFGIRIIIFLLALSLVVPTVIPFTVYMLFKTIILENGNIDIKPAMITLGKWMGLGNNSKDDEIDVTRPEEYQLVDEIKN